MDPTKRRCTSHDTTSRIYRPQNAGAEEQVSYPLTGRDRRQLARKRTVKTLTGEAEVEVPDSEDDAGDSASEDLPVTTASDKTDVEVRQSLQVQAKLAQIGATMGFHVWIPAGDRWPEWARGPILTPVRFSRCCAMRNAVQHGGFLAAYRVDLSVRSTFDRMPPLEGLCSTATLGRAKSFAIWNTDCGPPHLWCEWNSRSVFVQFARRP